MTDYHRPMLVEWEEDSINFAEAMERKWWLKGFIAGGLGVGSIVLGMSLLFQWLR